MQSIKIEIETYINTCPNLFVILCAFLPQGEGKAIQKSVA